VSERPTGGALERLVRDVELAMNEGDAERLTDLLRLHPDFEFHSLIAAAEGRFYRGEAAASDFLADLEAVFTGLRWEFLGVREVSDDKAIVEFKIRGTGRGSGIPWEIANAQVWIWRDGRLWRSEVFPDLDAALQAARK
jgi:ketosteroid isomerase-like protein